jgi:predicted O-methyltransferase YrrM
MGSRLVDGTKMTRPSDTFPCPAWATGHISRGDATFITELIQETAANAAVEIGVAAGVSTSVLLRALASVHGAPDSSSPWLYSFDLIDYCCFDASRPIGAAVDEIVPELRAAWQMTVGSVLDARRLLSGRELPFAFIDADHRHPWATLELMALLPVLRRGAWVTFHDIRLPQVSDEAEYQVHGPQYVFEAWPWTKRTEPLFGNTGACRLDASVTEILAFCMDVLGRDWEVCPPLAVSDALGLPTRLGERNAELIIGMRQALRPSADGRSRPLVIWGAGQAGRKSLALLKEFGFRVDGFVDRDHRKQAGRIDGLDVRDPSTLDALDRLTPFVATCGVYAAQIAEDLEARGFKRGQDFVTLLEQS